MSHHILIVESDPRLRDLLREMLAEEQAGIKIQSAASGTEALAKMHHGPMDILIASWQMPDMDGMTLVEQAQALHPHAHAILLTAADQDEVRERCDKRQISFSSFTKPFSIEIFLDHIDRVLTQTIRPVVAGHNTTERQSERHESGRRSQLALRPALRWG